MSVLRDTIKLISYRNRLFLAVLFFNLIFFLSPLGTNLAVQEVFDNLQGIGRSNMNVWGVIALIPVSFAIRVTGLVFFVLYMVKLMWQCYTLLRKNLLARILSHPGAETLEESSGEIISRFRGDVETIGDIGPFIAQMITFGVFAVLSLIIMFSINSQITGFILIPMAALVIAVFLARKKVTELNKASRRTTGKVTSAINEFFSSIRSIKVTNSEKNILKHFDSLNQERKKAAVKDNVLLQVINSLYGIIISLSVGIMFLLVGREIQAGRFSVGNVFMFLNLTGWLTGFVGALGNLIATFQRAGVSYNRLAKIMKTETKDVVEHSEIYLDDEYPAIPAIPKIKNHLETFHVKNLSYSFPNSDNGIKDISFEIKKGSLNVITGRIGSGKTTVLRSIQGLYEIKGELHWNGQIVNNPRKFFRPPISAYTSQVPALFSESVKDNISLGLPEGSINLEESLKLAVIDEDIETFDQKLNTMIGPKGVKLSGGQKQRVAAARMFTHDSELFILDDISSALDVKTEKSFWNRVFKQKNSTYIVSSHRKAVLKQADQIILLKDGEIDSIGTLDELLRSSEEMKVLWESEIEKK